MTASEFVEWRKRHGLTQRQLGEALGRTNRHIIRYETGDRPIPRVVELALLGLECRFKVTRADR